MANGLGRMFLILPAVHQCVSGAGVRNAVVECSGSIAGIIDGCVACFQNVVAMKAAGLIGGLEAPVERF